MNSGGIALLIYLVIVIWALTESAKRLMTLLWVIVAIATTLGLFMLLGEIMPWGTVILGHAALPVCIAISAFVGVTHMRVHRRAAKKAA